MLASLCAPATYGDALTMHKCRPLRIWQIASLVLRRKIADDPRACFFACTQDEPSMSFVLSNTTIYPCDLLEEFGC